MFQSKTQILSGLILCGTVFTGITRADQPPLGQGPAVPATPAAASPRNDSPRVASPYWNNDDPGSTAGQSNLPAADIRAVPPAMAQATQTHWTFNQTQDDLAFALRLNQMQFDRRPDVVAALSEQQVAYDALQKERARVLAPLNDNAAYKASAELSGKLTEQIADERDQDKPNDQRLKGMAAVRLNYVQDNRKLESSLLERDEDYQKARQRYIDASRKVSDLRKDQALAVMTDPNLITLRRQVAVARIDKLTAAAYLSGVIYARDTALDYAGFYRNTGYLNNYYGYYPWYSYGYGIRY